MEPLSLGFGDKRLLLFLLAVCAAELWAMILSICGVQFDEGCRYLYSTYFAPR